MQEVEGGDCSATSFIARVSSEMKCKLYDEGEVKLVLYRTFSKEVARIQEIFAWGV